MRPFNNMMARPVRRLARLGTTRYWKWRNRLLRFGHSIDRSYTVARYIWPSRGKDPTKSPRIVWHVVAAVLPATVLLVVAFGLEELLHAVAPSLLSALPNATAQPSFAQLVVTILGAEVFLLAIFYATLGTMISGAYQRVPSDIRHLLITSTGSRFFTSVLVNTIVFGILLLLLDAIGRPPPLSAPFIMVALATSSVVGLVVVALNIFRLSDFTLLVSAEPKRFMKSVRAAAAGRFTGSNARQKVAYRAGAYSLGLYDKMARLLADDHKTESTALERLSHQLLDLAARYAKLKSRIPETSWWYQRAPHYADWLTLDHSQLSIALETHTSVRPKLLPDRTWVEKSLAGSLHRTLRSLYEQDWPAAARVTDRAVRLIEHQTSLLQIDEALVLRRELSECLAEVTGRTAGETVESARMPSAIEEKHLAVTERQVQVLTAMVLGVSQAARYSTPEKVRVVCEDGVSRKGSQYQVDAPLDVLPTLSEIAAGVHYERKMEGKRTTGAWWIEHYVARGWAHALGSAATRVLGEIRVAADESGSSLPIHSEALQLLSMLELSNKMDAHLPVVQTSLDDLGRFNHPSIGETRWPDFSLAMNEGEQLRKRLLDTLATCLDSLDESHDPARPDLFGQSYKTVLDGAFNAIVSGDNDVASKLTLAIISTADRARLRLFKQLAEEPPDVQLTLGTEPLLDMMEISGCALLVQELKGEGVWDSLRSAWDRILTAPEASDVSKHFNIAAEIHEVQFAITPGSLERHRRMNLLRKLLDEEGVARTWFWNPISSQRVSHSSPVVRAFLATQSQLTDVFLAEYLHTSIDQHGLELPTGAASLKTRIERERQESSGPDGPEVPKSDARRTEEETP